MAKAKSMLQEYKVLVLLSSGKVVTKEEIETTLANEIELYRLSTYLWRCRKFSGAKMTVNRVGKKVVSWQLTNPEEIRALLKSKGITPIEPQSKQSTALVVETQKVEDTQSVSA
jgi:hypothetical protein